MTAAGAAGGDDDDDDGDDDDDSCSRPSTSALPAAVSVATLSPTSLNILLINLTLKIIICLCSST